MRILVTGGAGFIGSHLVGRLREVGHTVSILDDLDDMYAPSLKRANLALIGMECSPHFHYGDIRDSAAVESAVNIERPEVIVHLAARAGVRPSLVLPLLYEQVNVGGTVNVLEAARRRGVAKVVFASSSSVYGVSNAVPFSEEDPVSLPVSPYAATKLAGEHMCFTWSHLYGLSTICLRFFTVYGPRQRPDLAIRKFTELIDRGERVYMFGDGSTSRDYTHVDDTVAGVVAAIRYESKFDVFNIGNSSPITLSSLLGLIEENLGRKALIERVPEQRGDVPCTYADITKAKRLLRYDPQIPLTQGIAQFVRWYKTGCLQ